MPRLSFSWRAKRDVLVLEIYPRILKSAIDNVRGPIEWGSPERTWRDHARKRNLENLMLAIEGFNPNWLIQFADGETIRWNEVANNWLNEFAGESFEEMLSEATAESAETTV